MRRTLVVLLWCCLMLPAHGLVEPEVEAWQAFVAQIEADFGTVMPLGETAREFGNFGSSLAAAPFTDLMSELEQRRGLKFKYFTPWHVKSKAEFAIFIKAELAKEYPPEKVERDEVLLKAVGLVPLDFNLLEFYGDLLADAVAGVYNPATDQFFLIDMERGMSLKDRVATKAMTQLLGDSSKTIIIHELDHALGGQHFPLKTTMAELSKTASLDQQMAIMCLVEGDATFVMMDHQNKRPASEGGSQTLVGGAEFLGNLMTKLPGFIPGVSKFADAPLFYQKTLIFPYFGGAEFISTLRYDATRRDKSDGLDVGLTHDEIVKRTAKGWESINGCYKTFPSSTEQILHPFRYLYLVRQPMIPDFAGIPEPFGPWQKVGDDTGGELFLRIVLEQHGVENYRGAADGWHGDRIRTFRNKETGALGFYWVILWDNLPEADEFYNSLGSHLPFVVERDGARVMISLAFDEAALKKLRTGLDKVRPKPLSAYTPK